MGYEHRIERRRRWNSGLRERFRRLEERWNQAHPPIVVVEPPADSPSGEDRDDWTRLGLTVQERRALETTRPNVLVIGPGPAAGRVLRVLTRLCAQPVVSCDSSPLTLPRGRIGTLTVPHVEHLLSVDQQLLYAWLSCSVPRPQLITTASVPLFPAVLRGTFNDALFYRLNEVCLQVDEVSGAQATPAVDAARARRA